MSKGTVKFFNETKGFGFIKDAETGEEHFVHITGLIDQIKEDSRGVKMPYQFKTTKLYYGTKYLKSAYRGMAVGVDKTTRKVFFKQYKLHKSFPLDNAKPFTIGISFQLKRRILFWALGLTVTKKMQHNNTDHHLTIFDTAQDQESKCRYCTMLSTCAFSTLSACK